MCLQALYNGTIRGFTCCTLYTLSCAVTSSYTRTYCCTLLYTVYCIQSLAGAGQWGPAIGLLAEMRDDINAPAPDVISLSTTMDACTTGKRPDLALQLFDNARSERGWLQRGALDLVCYGSALKACAALSASSASSTVSTSNTTSGSSSDSVGSTEKSDATATASTDTIAADAANSAADGKIEATVAAETVTVNDTAVVESVGSEHTQHSTEATVATEAAVASAATAATAPTATVTITANEGGRRARELLLEMLAGPKHVQPNGVAYSCAIKACSQGTVMMMIKCYL